MSQSTQLSIAVHILALLEVDKGQVITSDYIASSAGTNPVVIRRIMSVLKKQGFIHSSPGVGGIQLLKPASSISLYDLYRALGLDRELFAIHSSPNPHCRVGRNIQSVLNDRYTVVQKQMETELKACRVSDLIDNFKA